MKDIKILERFNSLLEENMKLKKKLSEYQKDNNNLAYCLKDVDGVDKGIDEFEKEINSLQEENIKRWSWE